MNSITLVAASTELRSPFFLENKRVCEEWEVFIKKHKGELKGKCSAWAFIVQGEITEKANWNFKIKKSTISVSNIFISSKKSIVRLSTIQASNIDLDSTSFQIRSSNWLDFVRLGLSSKYKKLNGKLILKASDRSVEKLWFVELIKELAVSAKVDMIKYNHREKTLILHFQSILDDFDFVERLMAHSSL